MHLSQKSRAKSVPNLDIYKNLEADVPRFAFDSRMGVNYAVGQLLGKGGFAKCYLARSNQQYFALKVISRLSITKHTHLAKIRKEIYTHFSLRHPNIVALYNTFEDDENIYMLLEYCPNRTLADHIETSLTSTLRYLHYDCGLLHRDIKPGNILLSREMTVKLADFGFCCSIHEVDSRELQTVCGTPNYVPMEVIDKCGHSVYSECWAIACTFYSMFYGRPPFHSSNLDTTYSRIRQCDYTFPERYPPVSAGAKDLIRRTLIRERKKRLCIDAMLAHPALNPPRFGQGFISNESTLELNETSLAFQHFGQSSSLLRLPPSSTFISPTLFSATHPNMTVGGITTCAALSPIATKQRGQQAKMIDSGLGSSDLANGTAKFMQLMLDKYISVTTSIMDAFHSTNLVPIKSDTLPSSFVVKWVDYTNKYGFGVTLCDGTRSILFNDHSSLSSTACQQRFSFRGHKFNENCVDWEYSEGLPSTELNLRYKVSVLHIMRDYMDHELSSSMPIQPHTQISSTYDFRRYQPRRKQSGESKNTATSRFASKDVLHQALPHIVDFRKFNDALFMFLSDGTCQVNFSGTHDKFVICSVSRGSSSDISSQDALPYHVHLITGDQRVYSFKICQNYDFDVVVPPLSDRNWALLRAFQRVLQSYQHFLLSRCYDVFSTCC